MLMMTSIERKCCASYWTAHHQPAVIGGWGGLYHVNGLWSASGCGNVHDDGLVRPMRGGSMDISGGGGNDWSDKGGNIGGPGDGAPRLMLDSEPVVLAALGDKDRRRFRCRPPECANCAASCCCCILRTKTKNRSFQYYSRLFRYLDD